MKSEKPEEERLSDEHYISTSRLVSAMSAVILVFMGWGFTMMIKQSDSAHDALKRHADVLAANQTSIELLSQHIETRLETIIRRMDRLETRIETLEIGPSMLRNK